MSEAPRFEATRRARFDFATSIGSLEIDRTREVLGDGNVKCATSVAVVFDEPKEGRSVEKDGETM